MANAAIHIHKERRGVGIILGLWLTGVFAAPLFGRIYLGVGTASKRTGFGGSENDSVIITAILAISVLWPLLYFMFGQGRFVPSAPSVGRLSAVFGFAVFGGLSIFVSPVMFQSISYFCMTLAGIFLAMQFNSNLGQEQFEKGLKLYAILMSLILIMFAMYDYQPGVRLGNGKEILNPNTVSLVAVSVILTATAIRTAILRYALMVPVFGVVLLTGSRASTIAALAGLVIIFMVRMKTLTASAKFTIFLLIAVAVIGAINYSDIVLSQLDNYFALNDRYRGVSSGASGRGLAWLESLELFYSNPLIGIGFRAHEYMIHTQTSAHNGYLAMLAEIGLPGFVSIIFLILAGLVSLWRGVKSQGYLHISSIFFGFCIGYLFLAVFERYLINIGNPTSLLFLMGILQPEFKFTQSQNK